ncbi:MAG: DinB family protein [Thermomicrobiales bacterium]
MTSVLSELYRHNLWANLRLIDACAALPDETIDASIDGTLGSIRETFAHIARAEAGYVVNVTRGEYPAPPGQPYAMADLRAWLQRSGEAMIAIAEETHEDRVWDVQWQGNLVPLPLSIVLTQVINHATDHRSQICTTLTQQGVTPPDLQGWAYLDEQQRASGVGS